MSETVEPLWGYPELTTYLGMSKRWCEAEVRAGRIPHTRHGRKVRFDPHEIRHWNSSKTVRVSA